MIRLLALAALALAAPLVADDDLTSASVRTTFVVRDIGRSMQFYRHAFGYSVAFDGQIGDIPANRVLLALTAGQDARFVVLDCERTFSGRTHTATGIGLLTFTGRDLPRLEQPGGNAFASGQAMLAMMTSDLDTVIARLRELGAPILAGPVTGHEGREREIVTSDPDGTRIHVVERLPG